MRNRLLGGLRKFGGSQTALVPWLAATTHTTDPRGTGRARFMRSVRPVRPVKTQ